MYRFLKINLIKIVGPYGISILSSLWRLSVIIPVYSRVSFQLHFGIVIKYEK